MKPKPFAERIFKKPVEHPMRTAIGLLVGALLVAGLVPVVRHHLRVDRCWDNGGAYDYEQQECLLPPAAIAATKPGLNELQGAWWSDKNNPTADFAILGEQARLDHDSGYHPCKVEGDILVFDLGDELGLVRHRIVSLSGDQLTLERPGNKQRWFLTRETP